MNRKQRTLAVNIAVVALVVAGLVWIFSLFVRPGSRAWTNNAQVRRNLVSVNSRVQGFAESVRFDEYAEVHEGDTLVVIESQAYRLQVAQAEAGYQNALTARSAQGTTIRLWSVCATCSDSPS